MTEPAEPDGTVAVVGSGPTARAVAIAAVTTGFDVALADPEANDPERTVERAEFPTERRERIEATSLESALERADLVVETSGLPARANAILERADAVAPADATLATTTSTPSITALAEATGRPGHVVGAYLTNPSADVVELARGIETSDEAASLVRDLFEAAGTTTVDVDGDVPGSVRRRLEVRLRLEAIRRVEEGHDPGAIDAAVRRLGFPRGPLEAADREGLADLEALATGLGNRGMAIRVPALLSRLVDDGSYGVETGVGFYEYDGGDGDPLVPRERRYEFDPWPLFAPVINEAAWLLEHGVATREGIDDVLEDGANWPRGPLELADEYGLGRVLDRLEEAHAETGWAAYEPRPTLEDRLERGAVGLASGRGFYEYEYEATTFETVRYERRDWFAVITLDRPHVLNALDRASWLGLREALEYAAADDGVRATILRGAGRAFSAGDDIAEMYGWEDDSTATTFFREVLGPTVEALRTHPKPTIAVVDGIATGGGCELVLVCDLAVTTPESELGLPEALIGAIPPIAPAYGLSSLRKKDFMELAFTGDRLSGTEATERGLVNYAVDGSQVEDVARELARATTAASPASAVAIKERWNQMETELHESFFDACLEAVAERVQSADGQEGMGAFLEKRPPEWNR